ncbi:hypothetical protein Agub_g12379, partial [Astrephomene gubernaculifera]
QLAALQAVAVHAETAAADQHCKASEELHAQADAVEVLQKELEATKAKHAELAAQLRSSLKARQQLGEQISSAQSAHHATSEQLIASEAARAELVSKLAAADALVLQLQGELEVANARKADVEDRIAALRSDADRQQLMSLLESAEAEACRSAQRGKALEEQLADREAAGRVLSDAAVQVDMLQALEEVQARLAALRAEADVHGARVALLEDQLALAVAEQEKYMLEAAAAVAHSEMLEAELHNARVENEHLEQQLANLRGEGLAKPECQGVAASRIAELESQLANMSHTAAVPLERATDRIA